MRCRRFVGRAIPLSWSPQTGTSLASRPRFSTHSQHPVAHPHPHLPSTASFTGPRRSRSSSKTYMTLLLWAVPVTAFGLGVWQVRRLQWKLGVIEQAKLKFQQPAVPLDNLLSSHTNSDDDDDAVVPEEFQLVSVEGFFVFDEEMTVGPRSRGPAGREASGGLISKPQAGYFVYCPFITRSGLKILVNRGWVPYDMKDRHKRESLVDHDAKGQNVSLMHFLYCIAFWCIALLITCVFSFTLNYEFHIHTASGVYSWDVALWRECEYLLCVLKTISPPPPFFSPSFFLFAKSYYCRCYSLKRFPRMTLVSSKTITVFVNSYFSFF